MRQILDLLREIGFRQNMSIRSSSSGLIRSRARSCFRRRLWAQLTVNFVFLSFQSHAAFSCSRGCASGRKRQISLTGAREGLFCLLLSHFQKIIISIAKGIVGVSYQVMHHKGYWTVYHCISFNQSIHQSSSNDSCSNMVLYSHYDYHLRSCMSKKT